MIPITWLWIGAGILMAAFLVCAGIYALGVVVGIYKELKRCREQTQMNTLVTTRTTHM